MSRYNWNGRGKVKKKFQHFKNADAISPWNRWVIVWCLTDRFFLVIWSIYNASSSWFCSFHLMSIIMVGPSCFFLHWNLLLLVSWPFWTLPPVEYRSFQNSFFQHHQETATSILQSNSSQNCKRTFWSSRWGWEEMDGDLWNIPVLLGHIIKNAS